MNYLKVLIVIIWKFWFFFLGVLFTAILGIPVYLFIYLKNDKLFYFLLRIWANLIFYCSGFRYTIKSDIKLDNRTNYIFISNHTSLIDTLLMFILHPNHPPMFLGKKEIESYFFIGKIFKRIAISVDRKNKESRTKIFSVCKRKLNQGKNIVIYPEAGVPDRDVILANFKDGAFAISKYCEIPIVIYVFHNLKNMLPFSLKIGYPGNIKIERVCIINPENETKESLKEKIYNIVYDKIKNDFINYPEFK